MMQTKEQGWVKVALHDLCQPLTALECRLYLAGLEAEEEVSMVVEVQSLREAYRDALIQCERMMAMVRKMQERLNHEEHV